MIQPADCRLLLGCKRNMKLMGGKPNIGSYQQRKEKDCVSDAINALKWFLLFPPINHF